MAGIGTLKLNDLINSSITLMWSHRILAACFHEINPLLDLEKQAANNDPEKQADHQPCRVMWMDHASI